MDDVIRTVNLTKVYGGVPVVDSVNLSVGRGEIYGFLGLNGAGKTTTIRLLLGMIKPSRGDSYLLGERIGKASVNLWHDVGYIVEAPNSYPELTVRDNLDIFRRLRGIRDGTSVDFVIKLLKLERYAAIKAGHLSLGNAQRLGLAKALIHKPKVLLLDEPTNGLDPAGILEIRRLLVYLAGHTGVTVLVSSHRLDEISKMATNIGIIHEGRLIREIKGEQLENLRQKSLLINSRQIEAAKSILREAGYRVGSEGNFLELREDAAVNNPDKIASLLVYGGHPPTMLKVVREDLEEFFLRTIRMGQGGRG